MYNSEAVAAVPFTVTAAGLMKLQNFLPASGIKRDEILWFSAKQNSIIRHCYNCICILYLYSLGINLRLIDCIINHYS